MGSGSAAGEHESDKAADGSVDEDCVGVCTELGCISVVSVVRIVAHVCHFPVCLSVLRSDCDFPIECVIRLCIVSCVAMYCAPVVCRWCECWCLCK